jgi:hypothetical protein
VAQKRTVDRKQSFFIDIGSTLVNFLVPADYLGTNPKCSFLEPAT